jgi:alpha-mannosidase
MRVWTELAVAPGVPRVDVRVRVDNPARDHRVRLLFPTGAPAATCLAATTFDVAERSTAARDGTRWVHPATATFPHQGWVAANGLTVVAPGLPEAEVTPDGTIAITVLRAVGWLSRFDLRSRPTPAGPMMPLPGAQVPGVLDARLSLLAGADPVAARDAELGLRGVIGGAPPLLDAGRPLLVLEPPSLLLSAVKPAEDGNGIVVRVLNPGGVNVRASLRFGFDVRRVDPVRLDEEPAAHDVVVESGQVTFDVPPHALRSVRLR